MFKHCAGNWANPVQFTSAKLLQLATARGATEDWHSAHAQTATKQVCNFAHLLAEFASWNDNKTLRKENKHSIVKEILKVITSEAYNEETA